MPRRLPADRRKISVRLSVDVLDEMEAEARRQDRSLSKIAQMAWTVARERLRACAAPEPPGG